MGLLWSMGVLYILYLWYFIQIAFLQHAISMKCKSGQQPAEHWLDHANDKFDVGVLECTHCITNLFTQLSISVADLLSIFSKSSWMKWNVCWKYWHSSFLCLFSGPCLTNRSVNVWSSVPFWVKSQLHWDHASKLITFNPVTAYYSFLLVTLGISMDFASPSNGLPHCELLPSLYSPSKAISFQSSLCGCYMQ